MAGIDKARGILLRALDQLEKAEQDLGGEVERVDLVVIYSLGREVDGEPPVWEEIRGYTQTPGPKWVHAKLMERAAEAYDTSDVAVDDEDEEQ